jgi:polyisoprenoid-binding protein YceI
MKLTNLVLMAGTVVALASCGGNTAAEATEKAEATTLTVDTEKSVLMWKGMENPEYFHVGTVKFNSGSVELVDGNMASGEFEIDMTQINVTDEGMPEEKKAMLAGHLSAADFFNTGEFKVVKVKAGQLEAGKLPITISILGNTIEQTVPVTLTEEGGVSSLKGKFDVDFTSLDRSGFKPKEGQTEHVQPVISFELDVKLK